MALKPPAPAILLHPSVRLSITMKTMAATVHHRLYSAPTSSAIPPSKQKYVLTTGAYPLSFLASGTHIGIKHSNTRHPDLALIVSTIPCSAAAVFTQNKFQAAPVLVSREVLRRRAGEGLRAIVVNSGCANAVTGRKGVEDAEKMGREVDRCFGQDTEASSTGQGGGVGSRTLVMSTGVIGQPLPITKILSHIPPAHTNLSSTHDAWLSAARAICTTDTFPKLLSMPFTLPSSPGTTYHICGMTKGAGMIHPNMATLLGILCTDAPVASSALPGLLSHAVERSFNAISVDGDTSTNDTVAILANGAGGGPPITSPSSPGYAEFLDILTKFSSSLAQLIIRDGEGATKFVTIRVTNAASFGDAKRIASTIARSPLVKTALYGKDANWGRILCATGYADGVATLDPSRTSVSFRPTDGSPELKLLVSGEPECVDEARAAQILEMEDLEIVVDLGVGGEEAVYWTCDFSHEYVTINGDYRT
ncbi:hypothetical protein GP486_007877 [Trichoglossum hirsutum]|uniref:Arginine biosynthesis bifunctional protein ArgJ, mitochondrial n=1 Tax=Trichoglossum hirsutum TaxID=265104 RepID=A0A9P8IGW2_9PEZI|nr:hypothetical protein GP486_007877 [Trichoglossum hirsutum]